MKELTMTSEEVQQVLNDFTFSGSQGDLLEALKNKISREYSDRGYGIITINEKQVKGVVFSSSEPPYLVYEDDSTTKEE